MITSYVGSIFSSRSNCSPPLVSSHITEFGHYTPIILFKLLCITSTITL